LATLLQFTLERSKARAAFAFLHRSSTFFYEGWHSYIGYVWVTFFKPSRAGSSWVDEILLLW
jgi:hypothetical protein